MIAGCWFPFDDFAAVAIWIVVAVPAGLLWGTRLMATAGETPEEYRRRWRVAPRTSLIAVSVGLLLNVFFFVVAAVDAEELCDAMRRGETFILFTPLGATALGCAIPTMWRLARMDRERR